MTAAVAALAAGLIIWNALVFGLYGLDKGRARQGRRRIREGTLLLCALFLGAPGALAGMAVWRHKTRKPRFFIGVPLLLVTNAGVYALLWQWASSL